MALHDQQIPPQEDGQFPTGMLFDADAFQVPEAGKDVNSGRRIPGNEPSHTQLGFVSPPSGCSIESRDAVEMIVTPDLRETSYFCRRVDEQFELDSKVGQMFLAFYRSFPGSYRYLLDVLLRDDTTRLDDEDKDFRGGGEAWYYLLMGSYAEIIGEQDDYLWVREQLSSAKSQCVGLSDLMVVDRMGIYPDTGGGWLYTLDGYPSEYIDDPAVVRLLSELDEWQMFVLGRFALNWHWIKNDRGLDIKEGPETCVRERLFTALWWIEFSMQAERFIASGLRGAFLALTPATRKQVMNGSTDVPFWSGFCENVYGRPWQEMEEEEVTMAQEFYVVRQAKSLENLRRLGNITPAGESRFGEPVGGGHNFENARAARLMSQSFGRIIERMVPGMGNDGGLAGKSERARELLGTWALGLERITLLTDGEPRVVAFDPGYVDSTEGLLQDVVEATAWGMSYLMVAAHMKDEVRLPFLDHEIGLIGLIDRFTSDTAGVVELFPEMRLRMEVSRSLLYAGKISEIRKLIKEITGMDIMKAIEQIRLDHAETMREVYGMEITKQDFVDAKEETEQVARAVVRRWMDGYYRFLMSQKLNEVLRVMNFMMTLCRLFRQDIRGILGGRIMPFVTIPAVRRITDIGDHPESEEDDDEEESAVSRSWGIMDGVILGEEAEAWRDVPGIPFWEYFLREDISEVVLLEVKSRFTPRDAWRPPATMYVRYARQIQMYLDDLWKYTRSIGRPDFTVKYVKMLHISVAGKYVFTLPVVWGGEGPVLLTRRSDGMTVERFE